MWTSKSTINLGMLTSTGPDGNHYLSNGKFRSQNQIHALFLLFDSDPFLILVAIFTIL